MITFTYSSIVFIFLCIACMADVNPFPLTRSAVRFWFALLALVFFLVSFAK